MPAPRAAETSHENNNKNNKRATRSRNNKRATSIRWLPNNSSGKTGPCNGSGHKNQTHDGGQHNQASDGTYNLEPWQNNACPRACPLQATRDPDKKQKCAAGLNKLNGMLHRKKSFSTPGLPRTWSHHLVQQAWDTRATLLLAIAPSCKPQTKQTKM